MIQLNERISDEGQKMQLLASRDDVEIIRMRAEAVYSGRQLAVMNLYFGRGATCREIGQLMGLSEGQTWRMITSLTDRLSDEKCSVFLRNREKFTSAETNMIHTHLFGGLSLQKTATKHRCTLHRVRKAIDKLKRISDTKLRERTK